MHNRQRNVEHLYNIIGNKRRRAAIGQNQHDLGNNPLKSRKSDTSISARNADTNPKRRVNEAQMALQLPGPSKPSERIQLQQPETNYSSELRDQSCIPEIQHKFGARWSTRRKKTPKAHTEKSRAASTLEPEDRTPQEPPKNTRPVGGRNQSLHRNTGSMTRRESKA
jgi:hypothetical protein